MTPASNTPMSHAQSLWDTLPIELQEIVLSFAGTLTLFLNNKLSRASDLDEETVRALWLDAFNMDWNGDLFLLPDPPHPLSRHGLVSADLALVKSRSMYNRLCERLPHATESNLSFGQLDAHLERMHRQSQYEMVNPKHGQKDCSLRLMHVAMRHMWLDVIQESINRFPYARADDCVRFGHVELLRQMILSGVIAPQNLIAVSIFDGENVDMVCSMDHAARMGYLDVLDMLHRGGCNSVSHYAMDMAVEHGRFDIVKWLNENRNEGCSADAMDTAAFMGHFEILKFLHENRSEGCTTRAMDFGAGKGRLDIVKFLHEKRSEGCTTSAIDTAAQNGHFDVLKFLHVNRSEGCTTDAMDQAARNGHFEIVKWLHRNRSEGCTVDAMNGAARHGHLALVHWLCENREEGDVGQAFMCAVEGGQIDVVEWLHETCGIPVTHEAIERAARYDVPDILQFLLDRFEDEPSDEAVRGSATFEIASMVLERISLERKCVMLQLARVDSWEDFLLEAISASFSNIGVDF